MDVEVAASVLVVARVGAHVVAEGGEVIEADADGVEGGDGAEDLEAGLAGAGEEALEGFGGFEGEDGLAFPGFRVAEVAEEFGHEGGGRVAGATTWGGGGAVGWSWVGVLSGEPVGIAWAARGSVAPVGAGEAERAWEHEERGCKEEQAEGQRDEQRGFIFHGRLKEERGGSGFGQPQSGGVASWECFRGRRGPPMENEDGRDSLGGGANP